MKKRLDFQLIFACIAACAMFAGPIIGLEIMSWFDNIVVTALSCLLVVIGPIVGFITFIILILCRSFK